MQIWDVLTILMLILTACVGGYFALIFITPNSPLNLLPPSGGIASAPTNTPTPIRLEPTWTASPTLELTPTRTPRPSNTPRAPFTAISIQQVDSAIIHPELACNWAGIGGTVVDTNNSHVIGTVVVLRGTLNGSTVDLTTVTGINKEYGPSGYEFVLGNAPVASNKTLYVQLVDLNGIPLSDKVEITTSADCSKNLVLVRFKKNR